MYTSSVGDIIHTSTSAISRPQLADLNGDGLKDVCVDDTVYIQDSLTGDFDTNVWPNMPCSVDSAHELKITDINSDGLNDFVFISPQSGNMGSLDSAVNLGDTNFQDWAGLTTQLTETPQNADLPIELEHGAFGTLTDLNGDGLKDLVYAAGTLKYRLNTGYGLGPELSTGISLANGWGISYDCNRDGLDDYLHVTTTTQSIKAVMDANGNVSLVEGADCWLPDGGDINNDGLHDSRYENSPYDKHTTAKRGQSALITSVTDGLGHQVQVTYNHLVSEKHYKFISPGVPDEGRGDWYGGDLYTPSTVQYPYKPVDRSMSVVTELATSNGNGGLNTNFYYYKGGKVDTRGRGFLGFQKIVVSQQNDKSYLEENFFHHFTSTEYYQNFPYTGRVKRQELYEGATSFQKVSDRLSYYDTHALNPEFVYESHRFQQTFEYPFQSGSAPQNSIESSHSSYEYDEFGNLTDSHTVRGSNRTTNSSGYYVVETPVHHTTTVNFFDNDVSDHLLGFRDFTRTNSEFEDGSDFRTTCQTFQQQAGTLDVYLSFNNCDWNPANGKTAQQSIYIRNTKGVITQQQVTATDPDPAAPYPTRTVTYSDFEYDIYPREITNNLGHVTEIEYDERHSLVAKVTDVNDFVSTTKYDPWGRAIEVLDETTENLNVTTLTLCDTTCPQNAAYYTSSRTTNQNQAGVAAPINKVFYNEIGQVVQIETHTQGGIVKVDKVYFDRGNQRCWSTCHHQRWWL